MNTEGLGESLSKALEQVPDLRSGHGLRHPLSAILALSVCAMASGVCSLYAIAQWGRMQDASTLKVLGFTYKAEGIGRTDDAMWGKHRGTNTVYKPHPVTGCGKRGSL